ncbi:MAG: hypothetical protein J0I06_27705 [Planctomycetes bacterium]|nr:hypothetical protein [Planctomycetota bacterium]
MPGFPYGRSRDAPGVTVEDRGHGPPLDVLKGVRFSGGFPEALSFFGQTGFAARFLRKWADTSPLAALDLHGIVARDWRAIDGPHLSGLRALGLGQSAGPGLTAVASSAHLSRLEALHLVPDRSNVRWATEQYRAFADSPLAGRVTRLSIVLADVGEALAFHGAPLDNLTALEIRTPRTLSEREEFDRAAAAAVDLLSRPDLDRVEELTLDPVTAQALADVDRTVLGRLRKLVLEGDSSERRPFPLTTGVLPPGLADLSLTVADGSLRGFAMLTKSPVVGRLRHLRLDGALRPTADAVAAMVGLSRALDVGRLETLRLGPAVCPSPAVRSALAGKFGARVRFG